MSNLNCRPDDLAYAVRTEIMENAGVVLEVLRLSPQGTAINGEPTWECRAAGPIRMVCGDISTDVWCRDAWLRPIRPHGDDEQDESKAWLPPVPRTVPVPTKEHAT